jgi:hypothetical protein
MIKIEAKYQDLLLEAVEELMYRVALQLSELKGGALTSQRKELSLKQKQLEDLQSVILSQR